MRGGMVCLDASLALKLLVVDEDSPRARSLWRSWIATGVEVVAPASIRPRRFLRKHVRMGPLPVLRVMSKITQDNEQILRGFASSGRTYGAPFAAAATGQLRDRQRPSR